MVEINEKVIDAVLIGAGRMGAEPSERLQGIVPAGWIPVSHLEAMKSTSGINVMAICDTDQKRLEKYARIYDIPLSSLDYEDVLGKVRPALVSIATRTKGRCDIIKSAIRNGAQAIYTEKPISNSIAECRDVLSVATKAGCAIGYGATRRYMQIYRQAREIIHSGELGQLQQISVEFGRSALLWTHPHSTDILIYLANSIDVQSISASCDFLGVQPIGNILDIDPIVESANIAFGSGVSGHISNIGGMNVRVGCEKGILTINSDGAWIEVRREKEGSRFYFNHIEEIHPAEELCSGTQNIFSSLKESILEGRQLPILPEEILLSQQILFGIVTSALQKDIRISLDDIDEKLLITGRSGNFYA